MRAPAPPCPQPQPSASQRSNQDFADATGLACAGAASSGTPVPSTRAAAHPRARRAGTTAGRSNTVASWPWPPSTATMAPLATGAQGGSPNRRAAGPDRATVSAGRGSQTGATWLHHTSALKPGGWEARESRAQRFNALSNGVISSACAEASTHGRTSPKPRNTMTSPSWQSASREV